MKPVAAPVYDRSEATGFIAPGGTHMPRSTDLKAVIATLVLAAAVLLACNGATDPDGPAEPIEQLPRGLTTDEQVVIEASNRFGFAMLAELYAAEPAANLFTSPLSAHAALSMALTGARDSTLDAMRETLGFGHADAPSVEAISESYAGLSDLLLDLDPRVELAIGNAAWLDEAFPFRDAWVDGVAEAFDARTEAVDFTDPALPGEINAWVNEATQGRIPEMVESLDPSEVLMLLNAIHFKGQWTDQFDPDDTRDAPFTLPDGSTKSVPMMVRDEGELGIYRGPDALVADLPHGGGAFRFTVVLPPEDGSLADLVAGLDAARWNTWMAGLAEDDVPVHLPKFTLEWERELKGTLESLGMGIAFVPGRANFGGMLAEGFDPQAAGTDLHVTRVEQK
ncbi:MAG: serpin family protein, partial [Gemmatimonadota bacterium]